MNANDQKKHPDVPGTATQRPSTDPKRVAPAPARSPANPASKPQGTTEDQIRNMENEGQAQEHETVDEP